MKFEESFIQSEEHRPNAKRFLASPDDNLKIPVIDLEKSSAEEVGKACREWGFFYLINHGVPDHVIRRLQSTQADFFALPLEEKRRISRDAENPMGYFNSEHTKNVKDWKEVFDFAPRDELELPISVDPNDPTTKIVKNRWPDSLPEFREACLEYAQAAMEVLFRVLELISRSLGLPDNRLNEFFKDDMSIARLNSYPECPKPELALGIGRHKDVGALTLLYQDEVGGLEVRCKENGQWVPAPPMPNSFVLNVADCVQVLTNDIYESIEHRAVVNDNRRRLSVPFFLIPSHYAMIKPLDEFVSEENPPKFREFNWGKFTKQRMREGLKNSGVADVQIDNFRI
ncbi:hypothetical protein SUGI_1033770 [Cryptomeria japonica]|nr:hypothetical protein SUGI_1033770 [Cryptomeria japonica]